MKILIATQKPFAQVAVKGIKEIVETAGYDLDLLEKYETKEQLKESVSTANAIIIRSDKIDGEVMDAAPNLKIVVRAGAGYDNVDLEAATKHGVVVMNTPGQNANAVAELAAGLLIFTIRNHFDGTSGTELKGKKIGLVAFGAIAHNLARIASGFGMEISAYSPTNHPQKIIEAGYKAYGSMEELFSNNNVVSLHIPSNPTTKKSIGYNLISKMKKNAILLNTARKDIIDEDGLFKALEERQDIKYVTDLKLDRHDEAVEKFGTQYFATAKKMGAQTAEANINAGLAAANQIVKFFQTGDKTFQVNK